MTVKKRVHLGHLLAITLLLAIAGTANAETVVGRWCDKQLPSLPQYNGILSIVVKDDGAVELRRRYGDGSSGITMLTELGNSTYAAVSSNSGDKYRIVSADGNLKLLDEEGLIRVATRLSNTPKPGDCGI